jgi:exocyst complex component 6
LFEKYATLLERQFSKRFKDVNISLLGLVDSLFSYMFQIVVQDDYQPMHVDKPTEKDAVLKVVWISNAEHAELSG